MAVVDGNVDDVPMKLTAEAQNILALNYAVFVLPSYACTADILSSPCRIDAISGFDLS